MDKKIYQSISNENLKEINIKTYKKEGEKIRKLVSKKISKKISKEDKEQS